MTPCPRPLPTHRRSGQRPPTASSGPGPAVTCRLCPVSAGAVSSSSPPARPGAPEAGSRRMAESARAPEGRPPPGSSGLRALRRSDLEQEENTMPLGSLN